ncbi:hypothetical protein ACKKBG_A02585 [Auxenochlorella protothecoides x Auxenochlorella symbiontica]
MAPIQPMEVEGPWSEMAPINRQDAFQVPKPQSVFGGIQQNALRPFKQRWGMLVLGGGAILLTAIVLLFLTLGSRQGPAEAQGGKTISAPPPPVAPSFSCEDAAAGEPWDWATPTAYNLTLKLEAGHFDGGVDAPNHPRFNASASIAWRVRRRTRCLVVQARGLSVRSVALRRGGGARRVLCADAVACRATLRELRPRSDDTWRTDLVAVDLGADVLDPGEGAAPALTFEYTGVMGAGAGLHRSQAFAAECVAPGTSDRAPCARALVATQLAATHARSVFPCVDVPRFRAVYNVAVEVPGEVGLTVLSNSPILRVGMGTTPGSLRHSFHPTPPMPTYLLAVAAGNLVAVKPGLPLPKAVEALQVQAWVVPGREGLAAFSADVAVKSLAFYTAWTGIEQPLTKVDFVAIPGKQGAMENWGLLLFDEHRFLHSQATGGSFGAWRAADVVCHEVAHQWFGNLVTGTNWTQLAFNEGLASFLEYHCLTAVGAPGEVLRYRAPLPQARLPGVHEGPTLRALCTDASPFRPAMVAASDAAVGTGGVEVYSKAATFLRMLEVALGGETLQIGLQALLHERALGSANFGDILVAAAAAQGTIISTDPLAGGLPETGTAWATQPLLPLRNASAVAAVGQLPDRAGPFCSTAQLPAAGLGAEEAARQALCLPAAGAAWTLPAGTGGVADQSAWAGSVNATGLFRTLHSAAQLEALAAWATQVGACPGADCALDEGRALTLSSALHDSAALTLAGLLPVESLLDFVDAMLRMPAAQRTGPGRYLLLVPGLETLVALSAGTNADCPGAMAAYAATVIEPGAISALAGVASRVSDTGPPLSHDATLGALSATQLAAALIALDIDPAATGAALCPALNRTALMASTAAGATASAAAPFISPDVEGAVYAALGAALPGCGAAAPGAAGLPAALRRCYLLAADDSAAERCLLALPSVRGLQAGQWAWALGAGAAQGVAEFEGKGLEVATRARARLAAAPALAPGVAAAAAVAGAGAGWEQVARALRENWATLGAERGCAALGALAGALAGQPAGAVAALTTLLLGPGQACPAALQADVLARARLAADVAPALSSGACAWLSVRA